FGSLAGAVEDRGRGAAGLVCPATTRTGDGARDREPGAGEKPPTARVGRVTSIVRHGAQWSNRCAIERAPAGGMAVACSDPMATVASQRDDFAGRVPGAQVRALPSRAAVVPCTSSWR